MQHDGLGMTEVGYMNMAWAFTELSGTLGYLDHMYYALPCADGRYIGTAGIARKHSLWKCTRTQQ